LVGWENGDDLVYTVAELALDNALGANEKNTEIREKARRGTERAVFIFLFFSLNSVPSPYRSVFLIFAQYR
jgi:hypothetical protein